MVGGRLCKFHARLAYSLASISCINAIEQIIRQRKPQKHKRWHTTGRRRDDRLKPRLAIAHSCCKSSGNACLTSIFNDLILGCLSHLLNTRPLRCYPCNTSPLGVCPRYAPAAGSRRLEIFGIRIAIYSYEVD